MSRRNTFLTPIRQWNNCTLSASSAWRFRQYIPEWGQLDQALTDMIEGVATDEAGSPDSNQRLLPLNDITI